MDQEWWHRNYNKWMDALSPEEREEAPTDTCREILLKFVMKMRAELKKEDNGLFQ